MVHVFIVNETLSLPQAKRTCVVSEGQISHIYILNLKRVHGMIERSAVHTTEVAYSFLYGHSECHDSDSHFSGQRSG